MLNPLIQYTCKQTTQAQSAESEVKVMVFSKKLAEHQKSEHILYKFMENQYSSGKRTYSILVWSIEKNAMLHRKVDSIMNREAAQMIWDDIISGVQEY